MKRLYFECVVLVLLLLNSFGNVIIGQVQAQKSNRSVFITGITYDIKTLGELPNTNIQVNSKTRFATNDSGRFSFYGSPGDSVVFTFIGYQPTLLVVPDTLKSREYVMGVFMREQTINLAEIIIMPRGTPTSIIITPVQTDQKTMDIAQRHVDKAVVEGLTQTPKVYDADMNAKKTMRTNQIRTEYKGMLVTPENAVGLSTQNYQSFNVIYGAPIRIPHKTAREIITNSESEILIGNFVELQRRITQPEAPSEPIVPPKKEN